MLTSFSQTFYYFQLLTLRFQLRQNTPQPPQGGLNDFVWNKADLCYHSRSFIF